MIFHCPICTKPMVYAGHDHWHCLTREHASSLWPKDVLLESESVINSLSKLEHDGMIESRVDETGIKQYRVRSAN